jgi:hypothetical protein
LSDISDIGKLCQVNRPGFICNLWRFQDLTCNKLENFTFHLLYIDGQINRPASWLRHCAAWPAHPSLQFPVIALGAG